MIPGEGIETFDMTPLQKWQQNIHITELKRSERKESEDRLKQSLNQQRILINITQLVHYFCPINKGLVHFDNPIF
jgi:hypothetical protein